MGHFKHMQNDSINTRAAPHSTLSWLCWLFWLYSLTAYCLSGGTQSREVASIGGGQGEFEHLGRMGKSRSQSLINFLTLVKNFGWL